MSYSECTTFEKKLAFHTAPALLGIKPACLFSVAPEELDADAAALFNQKARETLNNQQGTQLGARVDSFERANCVLFSVSLAAADCASRHCACAKAAHL